nr:acetyl-CoA hydrolase/transferase C-terminal domain-containing protein [Sphingomonas liriopis]
MLNQLDFVRGASASVGGKSIIACHSTAAGGQVSRIVSRLTGPVTTPRNDVHFVVTEHGYDDLRGKSIAERAKVLIALAHPIFGTNSRKISLRAKQGRSPKHHSVIINEGMGGCLFILARAFGWSAWPLLS